MKKLTLNNLIYSNYLKTSLFSILFIELALLVLYFNVTFYMAKENINLSLNEIKESVFHSVTSETRSINSQLKQISLMNLLLQKEHEYFFSQNKNMYTFSNPPKFKKAYNSVYYKENNNGGSSLIVSADMTLTKQLKEKIYRTEIFDNSFKTIVENNPNVVAVYFNSYDNMNRYYPFLEKAYDVFPSKIVMKKYNFYYEADLKHNPLKKTVWTDVYLDPAGQGWMVSNIVPIYNNDFLEGVTGIDVTLDTFINNILNLELPYGAKSFVINENGVILAMTKGIEKLLNIKELLSYKYKDVVKETIFKPKEFNIFTNKSLLSLKKTIQSDNSNSTVILNAEKYLFFKYDIKQTNWKVISLLEEKKVLSSVYTLQNEYNRMGYIAIFLMLIFYILFFIFLNKKSKQLVTQITVPMYKIISKTKNIGKNLEEVKLDDNEIYEINILNKNFNKMFKELSKRTKKLIEIESEKKISEKLANTDILTGLYNRRFLEDFSEKILAMSKREKFDISIILFDIDEFKLINDTYGHHIGDAVIAKIAKIANESVRNNDIVVRFGGDEFVIVLPYASLGNTLNIAESIKDKISYCWIGTQDNPIKFSLSFGVAQYDEKDKTINDTIIRADSALYFAKKSGRNNIKSST